MDAFHFDSLSRAFASSSSRRGVLPSLAAAFGLGAVDRFPGVMAAKKRRHKVKRNALGCVNVGRFCRHAKQCCSGICRGKKGQKKCKAHDTGGCEAGQQDGICGGTDVPCTTSSGQPGSCATTTGQAGYCRQELLCFSCTKDAECVPHCGTGAACSHCAPFCSGFDGTACVGRGPSVCI